MKIDNRYSIGDEVYVKTDTDQNMHIVTAIVISPQALLYQVTNMGETIECYDFELSAEEDKLKKVK